MDNYIGPITSGIIDKIIIAISIKYEIKKASLFEAFCYFFSVDINAVLSLIASIISCIAW